MTAMSQETCQNLIPFDLRGKEWRLRACTTCAPVFSSEGRGLLFTANRDLTLFPRSPLPLLRFTREGEGMG